MKKLLALFLACTMVLGLASCKEQDEEEKNTLTTEETVATMQDPIDALARCMVENNLEYNPEDPDFFWTALYYFAGGYGLKHEGVEELTDTYQLKVPSTVMEEYAIALFSDYKGLPELPEMFPTMRMQMRICFPKGISVFPKQSLVISRKPRTAIRWLQS